jgi:hypothetical protein
MLHHVIGLDLGQQQDHTALALLEWDVQLPYNRQLRPRYEVRTLKRWPLGTAYTDIVKGLVSFVGLPELHLQPKKVREPLLVIDQTGVGRPVVEMVLEGLYKAHLPLGMLGVTITSGHEVTLATSAQWHVPKRDLVGTLKVLLQTRRLHVAGELPEAAALVRELEAFRVKVTTAGNETFEAWRERDHDDMVFAAALACWGAEMWPRMTGSW